MATQVFNKKIGQDFCETGQTLLEAIIALSALLLTLSAISIAAIVSVNNSSFVKSQNLANKYAQDGIEYIRSLANSNYTDFSSKNGLYCLDENRNLSSSSSCPVNIGGFFIRQAVFTPNTSCSSSGKDTETKVEVSVLWSDSRCPTDNRFCHSARVVSCFSPRAPGP